MTAPVENAPKDVACDECGRAHQPYQDCPIVAVYHGKPDGFLKKFGS